MGAWRRIVPSRSRSDPTYPEWDPMSVDTGRRPAGPPPPGGRSGPRPSRRPRSVHDRVSFKPIAALLLIPVILATSILTAAVLAPPFAAAGLGVNEIRSRLDALGSDFTRIPRFPERSTIYAADGSVLTRLYLDNREIVELGAISRATQRAVLAIEDSDFFQHGALDVSSLIRAIIENARAGEVVQGGSTITQQLVGLTLGRRPLRQERGGQDPGARPGDPCGAAVPEGAHLRALPQPGVHGERRLRHRDGGAVLLPEARARAHPGRGSHARRLDPCSRTTTSRSTIRR